MITHRCPESITSPTSTRHLKQIWSAVKHIRRARSIRSACPAAAWAGYGSVASSCSTGSSPLSSATMRSIPTTNWAEAAFPSFARGEDRVLRNWCGIAGFMASSIHRGEIRGKNAWSAEVRARLLQALQARRHPAKFRSLENLAGLSPCVR